MTRNLIASAFLVLAVAVPAQADQFAVRLDRSYEGANPNLLEVLRITDIEGFSEDGAHYVVIEAPDEAYVEAFLFAIGRNATELNVLDADWFNPAMGDLTMSQRLGFLRSIDCQFCTS